MIAILYFKIFRTCSFIWSNDKDNTSKKRPRRKDPRFPLSFHFNYLDIQIWKISHPWRCMWLALDLHLYCGTSCIQLQLLHGSQLHFYCQLLYPTKCSPFHNQHLPNRPLPLYTANLHNWVQIYFDTVALGWFTSGFVKSIKCFSIIVNKLSKSIIFLKTTHNLDNYSQCIMLSVPAPIQLIGGLSLWHFHITHSTLSPDISEK